jgi:hypothetical protein
MLHFGAGQDVSTLEGSVVEVQISTTGEKVPVFLTDLHRDYWLTQGE